MAASLPIVPEKRASPPAINALDLIQFLRLSVLDMVVVFNAFYVDIISEPDIAFVG
jgi:hypothetical protein